MFVDGRERSEAEIVEAIREHDRLRAHGVTNLCAADDEKLVTGRAWGMLAEPSAHLENKLLASRADCAYEQIVNQKADGRFYDPSTGFTLVSVQIKHSGVGCFVTSRDTGTTGGKQPYNVADATHFQFRESRLPCRSLFVELRAFPFNDNGDLEQKTSTADHDRSVAYVSKRARRATSADELVEILKTRLFFVRASIAP